MNKYKPNDHLWFSRARDFTGYAVGSGDCELAIVHNLAGDEEGEEDCQNRAKLFAEAGTVYHETGLSPRELLIQRDEWRAIALAK